MSYRKHARRNRGTSQLPAKVPVVIDIGGGDGERLAHFLQRSAAKVGILLELSDEDCRSASAREVPTNKAICVLQGDPSSTLPTAITEAAEIVERGEADYIAISSNTALHDLLNRQMGKYKLCKEKGGDSYFFFGYRDVPVVFLPPEALWYPEVAVALVLPQHLRSPDVSSAAALLVPKHETAADCRNKSSGNVRVLAKEPRLQVFCGNFLFIVIPISAIVFMLAVFLISPASREDSRHIAATPATKAAAPTTKASDNAKPVAVARIGRPRLQEPGRASGNKREIPIGTPLSDGLTPTLKWYALAKASAYSVFVVEVDDQTGESIKFVVDGNQEPRVEPTSYTIPAGRLKPDTVYRWNCTAWVGSEETDAAVPALYFRTPAQQP